MSCTYYRWNGGSFTGDYWCDKKNERVNNDIYQRYCKGYYYDECPIYKKSNSSGGCFITTIICDILGKNDDDKVINNLRNFRDNILTKDEKYKSILIDYDNIGPVIAYEISKDKDKEKLSIGLYDLILTKVSDLIDNKDYEKSNY